MKKFKEGDRVRHKSGTGTTMVVKGYSEWTGELICKWFDTDKKEWKEELFEEEEVELEKKNSQRHEQRFKKAEEAPKPKKEIGF